MIAEILNWINANRTDVLVTGISIVLVVISFLLRRRRKKREKELEEIREDERMKWLNLRIDNPEYDKREGAEHPSQPFDINYDPTAQPVPSESSTGKESVPTREVLITVDRDISENRYRMLITGEINCGTGEHNTIRVEDDLVSETSFSIGALADGLYILRRDPEAEIVLLRAISSNEFARTKLGTKKLRIESGDRVRTGNTTFILEWL